MSEAYRHEVNGQDLDNLNLACTALEIQDACNLIAIVGEFHRALKMMHSQGLDNNQVRFHPVTMCYLSKLKDLCRFDTKRENQGISQAIDLKNGQDIEFEVIPL